MAQDVQIANVQYSDVPALEVPKVGGGTARFTDLSGDTIDANKVLQGYTGHDATGAPFTGTYIPPSGAISVVDTSDSHGGTVRTITAVDISDTTAVASDVASGKYFYTADGTKTAGTASGGGGGLEYEEGTYVLEADVTEFTISFANTHTVAPFFYMIADADSTIITNGMTNINMIYSNSGQLFGGGGAVGSVTNYGSAFFSYTDNGTPPASYTGGTRGQLTHPYTDSSTASTSYSRYWATETSIKASGSGRTWRAGRTYKWIAVWAPTT